jgi:pyruvyl transferase EpsO
MDDPTTPQALQNLLRQRLDPELAGLQRCVLLEYAPWANAGVHFLWLGSLASLLDRANAQIAYISSIKDFVPQQMDRHAAGAPIVFRAGALSDGWQGTIDCLDFYSRIIAAYPDRPVIFLPRSVTVKSTARLQELARTFNAHPQLSVLVRDSKSYALVRDNFRCHTSLMPDIAFLFADTLAAVTVNQPTQKILFLRRTDWPDDAAFAPERLGLANLEVEDWKTYQINRSRTRIRGLNRLVRTASIYRLGAPAEALSRLRWMSSDLSPIPRDRRFRYPWGVLHNCIYQLQQYRLVITNRLHAHILCVLLGIPNIALPGPHGNTDVIYQDWTHQIPYCRFAATPAEVKPLAQELLDRFPTHYRPALTAANAANPVPASSGARRAGQHKEPK